MKFMLFVTSLTLLISNKALQLIKLKSIQIPFVVAVVRVVVVVVIVNCCFLFNYSRAL